MRPVKIHDQTGTPLVFGNASAFVRAGRTYALTQPNGDPADEALFRHGIHPRERTWGNLLRAVVARERTRGRLSALLLGDRLVVTLHTEVTRTQVTLAAVEGR